MRSRFRRASALRVLYKGQSCDSLRDLGGDGLEGLEAGDDELMHTLGAHIGEPTRVLPVAARHGRDAEVNATIGLAAGDIGDLPDLDARITARDGDIVLPTEAGLGLGLLVVDEGDGYLAQPEVLGVERQEKCLALRKVEVWGVQLGRLHGANNRNVVCLN